MNTRTARRTAIALALAACGATLASATPQGQWSDEYDRSGLVGTVFSITTHAGALYAGGDALWGGGDYFGDLARFDGVEWRAIPSAPDGVLVGALQSFGSQLIVAGEFLQVGALSANNIAAWNGSSWSALGAGVNDQVFDLELFQGELIAAGRFSQAGGQPIGGIARWDGTQWRAVGGNAVGSISSTVWALEVGPDGRLYAGGDFDSIAGVAAHGVAAWNGTSWSSVGPSNALLGSVHTLEWHQGRLYAGGSIDFAATTNENVVVWDGVAWSSTGGIPDWSIASTVNALRSYGGKLYAGGNFVQAGAAQATGIASFDGSAWSAAGGVGNSSPFHNAILAFHEHQGELYVGGAIEFAGFQFGSTQSIVSQSILRFDGVRWDNVGEGQGFDAEVRAAIRWRGGIAAVGRFTQAGEALAARVSWFDGVNWRSLGAVNGNVNDCIEFEGDLVITGEFNAIDGQPFNAIARWNGTSWSTIGSGAGGLSLAVYQGELYAGGLGGFKRWNGSSWSALINPGLAYVRKMHVHDDGLLYIAGGVAFAGQRIYSYDGTTLNTLGAGVNDTVEALCSFQGDLIVGGIFSTAGGQPASRLARWNGSSWSAFPGVTGSLVRSLTVYQGELYAGGDLIAFSGNPADWIARWNGSTWQPLGTGLNGTPFTLVPDDVGGRLYVGGLFTQADWTGVFGQSTPSYYFGVWSTAPKGGEPYCVAKISSAGCAASMSASGSASLTSAAPFTLAASGVQNLKSGLMFYGRARATAPFGGGTLCVSTPLRRTPIQTSGGSPAPANDCSGAFSFDFNAWLSLGADPSLSAGDEVFAQSWYRDPQDPTGHQIGLSNAVRFVIGG